MINPQEPNKNNSTEQGNTGPVQESVQSQTIAEPVAQEVRPSLARRMHLKLFSLLVFVVLIIFAVFYYQTHPLPDFLSSQADKLPSFFKNNQTLRSSTVIQDPNASSSGSTSGMIVESAGRSETTYRLVSTVAGQGGELVEQSAQAVATVTSNDITNTPTSCIERGGAALSTRQEDSNCCPGLLVIVKSCSVTQSVCDPSPVCM
jgi:hypothetical protein